MKNKTIHELVSEHIYLASVLDCYGIDFFNHRHEKLEDICNRKALDVDQLLTKLFDNHQAPVYSISDLENLSVDELITHLKAAHDFYINHKLPYLNKLIHNLKADYFKNDCDLFEIQFLFSDFAKDFIAHIREEERCFFTYIKKLYYFLNSSFNLSEIFFLVEKHSLITFIGQHDAHDDEMESIRLITNDYKLENSDNLYLKVVYGELQSFEANLIRHARIEDSILFPKALELEQQVFQKIKCLSSLN